MPDSPREVAITGEMIRLGQLLKFADLIDVGAEVKDLLATRTVRVDGEIEVQRGRQLTRGMVVTVGTGAHAESIKII